MVSCTFQFMNSEVHEKSRPLHVYIHPVRDTSSYTGHAPRLQYALQDALSKKTKFILTNEKQAQYVIEVVVTNRRHIVLTEDDCRNQSKNSEGLIANSALTCKDVIVSQTLPLVSPASESLSLKVYLKVHDQLKNKVVLEKKYDHTNAEGIVFNSIGDRGDGYLLAGLSNTPDLHPLRHFESVDKAIEDYSKKVAELMIEDLKKL
jgi:hypothetical protein